ncbi:PREDICTED: (S)-scoulerine 9-O-methyltransferase-like [Fragaria vesca subsp. vesca]
MESHGSLTNHTSAWGLANSITIQMTLRAAIELNVFNIIAKSGRGTDLTSKEIVSQIPNTNPTLAVLNEDGVSFAPNILWGSKLFVVKSLFQLKYTVLEPESSPFVKANGETIFEFMSSKPEVFEVYKGFEEVKELMDVGGGDGSAIAKIWVLHNWDDEHCKKILKNCWEAIPDDGKVIVVEYFVVPEIVENATEMNKSVFYLDIFMMTTSPGGKERTIAEFEYLAKSVGFVETKIFPLPHGSYVNEFLKS